MGVNTTTQSDRENEWENGREQKRKDESEQENEKMEENKEKMRENKRKKWERTNEKDGTEITSKKRGQETINQ